MKYLQDFIANIATEIIAQKVSNNHPVTLVTCDSRQVIPGAIFCAIAGEKYNGNKFIEEAVAKGALTIISNTKAVELPANINQITVNADYKTYAKLCETFYNFPAQQLRLHAITGTNGKTTSAFLLHQILQKMQSQTALLSTVAYYDKKGSQPAPNTTPMPLQWQKLLDSFVKDQISDVVMEVSSHALAQHRMGSARFDTAIFTNLSGDHLDYHHDMENYFKAKEILFTEYLAEQGHAIINIDDQYGKRLAANITANTVTFGRDKAADCKILSPNFSSSGASCKLQWQNNTYDFQTPLIGNYNLYNAVGVFCAAVTTGCPANVALETLASPQKVPGRLEHFIAHNGINYFVDYAHTDAALDNVLSTLKEISPKRLITVFGCGGDRDKTKRPRMAQVAAKYSDITVVTSDNPRTENPDSIIADIMTGFSSNNTVYQEGDRVKAIQLAANLAKPADFVLIAGKGHENYQEINGQRHHLDDREIVAAICEDCFAH